MADRVPDTGAEDPVWDTEIAAAKLKEGKDLIDDDPDKAVELLCKTLRSYEKHYGGNALESAPAYLYYGIAVFEVARSATDVIGSAKTTVEPSKAPADTPAAVTEPAADPAKAETDGTATASTGAKDAAVVEAKDQEVAEAAPADGVADAASNQEKIDADANKEDGDKDTKDAADGADPAGDEDAEEEDEEDVTATGDEAEGGEGAQTGDAADDDSDMKLAWEMLEMARIIYEENNPELHRDRLVEVYKALGDIKMEEEQFDDAVDLYKQGHEHLEALQPRPYRRLAEMQYWLSKALTFVDKPVEALNVTSAAVASLEAAIAETEEKLAALPTDGSGGEVAEEEGRSLQETSDDLRSIIAEMHANAEGLKEAIEKNIPVREAIRQFMDNALGDLKAAGAAVAPSKSKTLFKAAAAVVSLGTVGRGSKRITLQPIVVASNPAQQTEKAESVTTESAAGTAPSAAPSAPAAKRTLEDLMGGVPAAGGETASGFEAVAVVETRDEGQHQAKKARTEEPAGETAAATADAK